MPLGLSHPWHLWKMLGTNMESNVCKSISSFNWTLGHSSLTALCFFSPSCPAESQLGLNPVAAEAEGMTLHASWLQAPGCFLFKQIYLGFNLVSLVCEEAYPQISAILPLYRKPLSIYLKLRAEDDFVNKIFIVLEWWWNEKHSSYHLPVWMVSFGSSAWCGMLCTKQRNCYHW